MRTVICASAPGTRRLPRFDRRERQRVLQLRAAARDQPHDVGADRREFERGDGGLQFDGRAVFDRAGDAVGDLDATLFAGRTSPMSAPLRERIGELPSSSSSAVPSSLPRADQIEEAVGKVEAHANAGRNRASLVAKCERRVYGHSRFQLAVGRNDERPEALRQGRRSGRENLRQGAHDAMTFRRPAKAPLTHSSS